MSTSVKHITSAQRGAPVISGNSPGSLIAAIDAMLNGWGVATPVSISVSGGIATATLTSGETFTRDSVVLVEGYTPSEVNGEARVLSTTLTSITWATTAADGTATGSGTIKYAPQTSWVKAFSGTNKAAYRSNHVQASGHYLRLDDTGTIAARIRAFESMTDVDTGIGPFPTDAQMSGGGYLHKGISATTTPVSYRIICDDRFMLICIAAGAANNAAHVGAPPRGFGDPIALAPGGDVWASVVSVAGNTSANAGTASFTATTTSGGAGLCAVARSVSGLGGSMLIDPKPFTGSGTSGADTTLGTMPSEVDGQIKTSKMYLKESGTKPPRAVVPGVRYIPQTGASLLLADGDTLDGAGEMAGRRLMVVADLANQNFQTAPTGAYLVDITGPWHD